MEAAEEELTASAGVFVIVEVAGVVGRGALEAKRTAAPFRIKRFVIGNWGLEGILASEGRF